VVSPRAVPGAQLIQIEDPMRAGQPDGFGVYGRRRSAGPGDPATAPIRR
jgi:hypothetical protein